MTIQDWTLAAAGLIGASVAIVHGVLIERLMVVPFRRLADDDAKISGVVGRLIWPMLQFSAFAWALGGLALIAASFALEPDARRPLALLVGALYAYGAIGNFSATGGRHIGWMLMALAIALIGVSLAGGQSR